MFLVVTAALLSFGLDMDPATLRRWADVTPPTADMGLPIEPGVRIAWDSDTLQRVSHSRAGYSSYPRMVELHDGTLLCVYESDGSIMARRSADSGKSWEEPSAVAWRQDGINMAAPDVLELQDKSILVGYNPRPWKIGRTRTFGIRTRKSYDGGRTWIHGRLLYEAGHKFGDGAWEPAAIQMPDGEIQLFFANESPFRKSNEQNVSLLRSRDGGLTWTEKPEVVSFYPGARDGMPVPLQLADGRELVCAIEAYNAWGSLQPAMLRSTVELDWAGTIGKLSGRREQPLAEALSPWQYAGAPYIRTLGTSATLLSYQGTEGRRNTLDRSEMKVLVGDAGARGFNRKTVPFKVPENRFATWNSVSVLRDDTVVALSSTNAFSFMGTQEVWMIKGRVIPELRAGKSTLKIDGKKSDPVWKEKLPLFIGQEKAARLRGGASHDEEYLYVVAEVKDRKVHVASADPENNDGVAISIGRVQPDALRETEGGIASPRPVEGVLRVFVTADNFVVTKEGKAGRWLYRDDGDAVRSATARVQGGYTLELAIPWELTGVALDDGGGLVMNMSLTNSDGRNVPEYRESLSACDEDKPYTWVPLGLE